MDNWRTCGCRSEQRSVEQGSERIKDWRTGGSGNFVLNLFCGLTGNVSHKLLCLNPWSPADPEVYHLRVESKFYNLALFPVFSVSCVCMHWVQPDSDSYHHVFLDYCHVFPAIKDSTCLELWADTNPFIPKLLAFCCVFLLQKQKETNMLLYPGP